jgi:hypothetical protein
VEKLRPNDQRAKMAITLIWITLAMDAISMISGYFQYNLLQTAASGTTISPEDANANDLREQLIGIIYLPIFIFSAVTFIQWFRRAYFNLHLRIKYLNYTENWAAICWFIPFVNLYRPYQIMAEMYNETKELLTKKGILTQVSLSTSFVGLWWFFWILAGVIGQATFRYTMRAESIEAMTNATLLGMLGNLISIPAAVLAVRVIKDYAEVEPLLAQINDDKEGGEGDLL